MAATTSPQIIDQLLADRRAYRWPRSPKFNLRKLSISGSDPPSVELPVRASLDRAALAGLALAARLIARQRLGTVLQRLALCLRVAIGGDHDDGNVRPQTPWARGRDRSFPAC